MSGQIPFAATCRIDYRRKTFACECLETKRAIQNKFYANEGHGSHSWSSENSPRSAQSLKSTLIKRSTPTSRVFCSPCKKALPLLKDGSSIILNASIVSSTGSPALSVYCASKAAVRSFVRTFTTDLKDRKIRMNAVSPGVIPSPGYRNSLGMTEEQVKQNADSVWGQNTPRSHGNLGRSCQ